MPWSLGSTVDKVFKRVGIPLIVVRAKEPPEKTSLFSRIVVPLDGSEKSAAVLPYVKELANISPCEVFPIRVVESGRHVRTVGGLDYIQFREQDISSMKATAKKYLEDVCTDLALTKAKVNCQVRSGDAAQEIIKFANEIGCTLIAMTSHGHHGIEAWALGSVTSKVISVAKQSVLLVPSFARR
jgi:nucleotide-binding universal stress UspA family protein